MEPNEKEAAQLGLLERFRKSWFPPAAVVGAFAGFVAAAFRVRPTPKPQLAARPSGPVALPILGEQAAKPAQSLPRQYSQSTLLGGSASAHPFRRFLSGIAIGSEDRIFALGDDEVRVFATDGTFVQGWKIVSSATSLTVGTDGRVFVGAPGRVEIYDAMGNHVAGFAAGDSKQPAGITAIKVFRQEILIADGDARLIRRYDLGGKQIGLIGNKSKTGGFMLPNRWLDFDLDAKGVIRATDTGRHLVTAWAIDGTALGSFGKFGMRDPADFVGCCNPVNLALAPDGKIVTAEKMIARVKVYEPGGMLLAVIGPEHFDPNCVHIHLAVDSKGRILAADPVRREVKIFSLVSGTAKPGEAAGI